MTNDFKGVIIEESLEDISGLKQMRIVSTRVSKVTETHKTPWVKQWTLHSVEIPEQKAKAVAEELSKALDSKHAWYADFKNDSHHYILFKNKIFYIDKKRQEQYDEAKKYGLSLGMPAYQVNFHVEVNKWKR